MSEQAPTRDHETKAGKKERRRVPFQPRQILMLALIWLELVGEVNVVTVVGGLLLGWLIMLVFPLPPVDHSGRIHPWRLLVLVTHLVRDLAVSSVRLTIYAFSTRVPHPGIVRVPLHAKADLYEVNTAELASVVPGTIVVDARRKPRLLYLHVFDLPDPATRQETIDDTWALERRVVAAFGSAKELADLDAAQVPTARPSGTDTPKGDA